MMLGPALEETLKWMIHAHSEDLIDVATYSSGHEETKVNRPDSVGGLTGLLAGEILRL
jgi:hypothetical protein